VLCSLLAYLCMPIILLHDVSVHQRQNKRNATEQAMTCTITDSTADDTCTPDASVLLLDMSLHLHSWNPVHICTLPSAIYVAARVAAPCRSPAFVFQFYFHYHYHYHIPSTSATLVFCSLEPECRSFRAGSVLVHPQNQKPALRIGFCLIPITAPSPA
jgi:hypothetical protein